MRKVGVERAQQTEVALVTLAAISWATTASIASSYCWCHSGGQGDENGDEGLYGGLSSVQLLSRV